MLRGHDADDDLGALQRGVDVGGRLHGVRQSKARQEAFIHPPRRYALADLGFIRPEPDRVGSIACQDDRQSCAPCSRADDCNAAHAFLAPRRGSVPATRRTMLGQCLQTTSREPIAISRICRGSAYSCSVQTSNGNNPAATTEPRET